MTIGIVETVLMDIGRQLDQGIFPRVKNGGIVTPSGFAVPSTLGEENNDEDQRRYTTTRPRQGFAGGEGPPGGSWQARQTTSLIRAKRQTAYDNELDAVSRAYPGTKVWKQEGGLWLLTESSLLPGLRRAAIFLTGISYEQMTVRSWGFWNYSIIGAAWIGPRHTNFPDGSICAFHPADHTWLIGDSIVELLDIYTVWALRHLHLEVFGRWPGPQAVSYAYERILEIREDEQCGCGRSSVRYRDCCRDMDLNKNRMAEAVKFFVNCAGGLREPPGAIVRSVRDRTEPADLTSLLLAW